MDRPVLFDPPSNGRTMSCWGDVYPVAVVDAGGAVSAGRRVIARPAVRWQASGG
jgi:hypothetical protein